MMLLAVCALDSLQNALAAAMALCILRVRIRPFSVLLAACFGAFAALAARVACLSRAASAALWLPWSTTSSPRKTDFPLTDGAVAKCVAQLQQPPFCRLFPCRLPDFLLNGGAFIDVVQNIRLFQKITENIFLFSAAYDIISVIIGISVHGPYRLYSTPKRRSRFE